MTDESRSRTSMFAQHPQYPGDPLKVAPTDGTDAYNTIRIPLVPVACWLLNDPAFAFDSSFVSPNFRRELVPIDDTTTRSPASSPLKDLSDVVAANEGCPVALFGHCDPEGTDDLNKTLGDRRAIAVYGLVTRQADLWAYLYDHPQVGDTWDMHMIQSMLANIPDGSGAPYYGGAIDGIAGSETTGAIQRFQGDAGQAPTGQADASTRKAIYGAYMDWLCTPDEGAPSAAGPSQTTPFRMQSDDFLGGAGAQPGDLPKMSLQSCGKFNPVVLLPSSEMSSSDKDTRHDDDAPNRRVIMFFFRQGTTVHSDEWPCPKVKETNAACAKAFWPGGDARRLNGDALRLYAVTRDTMACRFYDRFARRSPCEGAPAKKFRRPVYFSPLNDGVSVYGSPDADAQPTRALDKGDVVRIIEEKFDTNSYFVRFEPVDPDPSYYRAQRAPKKEWLCVSRDGNQFAFWSSRTGEPLSLQIETDDLDGDAATVPPDV